MCKNIFINKYKHLNIIEDQNNFLTKIKDLISHIVKFYEDNKMKPKIYLCNYVVGGNDKQLIIIITYDKYIFSIYNNIQRAQTRVGNTFL